MEQTVYIDLYFLINFSMDLLCFFLTSKLLSHKASLIRSIAAAFIGGIYACVALLFGFGGIGGFLLDAAACALMCVTAVKKKGNLKETAIYTLVYTAVSIVLGGFMTVLFSLFNKIGLDKLFGTGASDGISVWLFAVLAIISGVLSALGGRFFRKKSARRQGKVRIVHKHKSITLNALCDSGNMLREPISSKMCIVADRLALKDLLSRELWEAIDKSSTYSAEDAVRAGVRIIPASTVNGEGILYAIKPDSVMIDMGNGWREVDALVALGRLDGKAGDAEALIPSELAFGMQ